MSENRMAESARPLWDHLGKETKKHLIGIFVEFVLSNRGTRHPQYRLADHVLKKNDSVPAAKKALGRHARRAARTWIQGGYADEAGLAKTAKSVTDAMQAMERCIPDFEETIRAAVAKVAKEHAAAQWPLDLSRANRHPDSQAWGRASGRFLAVDPGMAAVQGGPYARVGLSPRAGEVGRLRC
jgi:hypothetical protein